MKKLLYIILCFMILAGCLISRAQTSSTYDDDEQATTDSTVDVIGWYTTTDTAVYWMHTCGLKITEHDTVATIATSTKFRIVVTDSTAQGYKMECTILDVASDSVDDAEMNDFQKLMTEKHARRMIGTTIYFETNDCGSITKINNLEQIKERLKTQIKECITDLGSHPKFTKIREAGIDVDKELQDYVDNFDADSWAERFLTPLTLLFAYNGLSFPVGEEISYVEKTDTSYAFQKAITAEYIDEYSYYVGAEVNNLIPMSDLHDFLKTIIDQPTESKIYDTIVSMKGADMKSYNILNIAYRYDGWPEEVYSQDVYAYGTIGKAYITQLNLINIPSHNY